MKLHIESWLRSNIGAVPGVSGAYSLAGKARLACTRVRARSPFRNIYYCCTQKTASQWLGPIFSDPAVYRYTGLKVIPYRQLGLRYASFREPFPAGTIPAHLYISRPAYESIPRPEPYRAFFMLRDPRDIVVSWYFSARHSHVPVSPIPELRRDLRRLDRDSGFRHIIDRLDEWGSFEAQRSWADTGSPDPATRIFRYESLAEDSLSFLADLFSYLEIPIPAADLEDLCARHTFKKYSGWRKQGVEDRHSHYRKGVAGDWKNHFNPGLTDYFREKTGNLLEVLGYPE